MFETFNAVMQSPDLDPEFPREENQDYHVIAAVSFCFCSVVVGFGARGRRNADGEE
jgi:hypothetical protein